MTQGLRLRRTCSTGCTRSRSASSAPTPTAITETLSERSDTARSRTIDRATARTSLSSPRSSSLCSAARSRSTASPLTESVPTTVVVASTVGGNRSGQPLSSGSDRGSRCTTIGAAIWRVGPPSAAVAGGSSAGTAEAGSTRHPWPSLLSLHMVGHVGHSRFERGCLGRCRPGPGANRPGPTLQITPATHSTHHARAQQRGCRAPPYPTLAWGSVQKVPSSQMGGLATVIRLGDLRRCRHCQLVVGQH